MINIIVAMTHDGVIGHNNKLLWNISSEIKHFKETTSGCTVVMGRKTWDSIPSKFRPLPGRKNIVISKSVSSLEGAEVFSSVEEALDKAKSYGNEVFVIGGAQIYALALPFVEVMYISYVKKFYSGDVYFPSFSETDWEIVKSENHEEWELKVYKRVNG